MYQQPPAVYHSADSIRRLSSNNPFRQLVAPQYTSGSNSSNRSQSFDDWVEKNRKFMDEESDEEINMNPTGIINFYGAPSPAKDPRFAKPQFPTRPSRTGSDSSVNYSPTSERKMSSNNPFASAMTDSYVHHRDPPPPPSQTVFAVGANTQSPNNFERSRTHTPPARPPKTTNGEMAPPSYEEAADPDAVKKDYPREKGGGSGASSGTHSGSRNGSGSGAYAEDRPRRSRSDPDRKDKERSSGSGSGSGSASRSHRSHRDREHREHRERDREGRSDRDKEKERRLKKSPSKKPQPVKSKNLDTIDKLDVTGFFGGGFHHDGPFDACTPHRNKNVKAAPVMAFPADGPNNSIQGFSNKDKHLHIDLAFGNYDDDQNEIVGKKTSVPYVKTSDPTTSLYIPKQNPSIINFDANQKAVPIHGEVTPGLGSSTFLDGAPAPKAAVAEEYLSAANAGLNRKKSIVQRLRKNSQSENPTRRSSNDADDDIYQEERENENSGNSLLRRVKSLKVGRK